MLTSIGVAKADSATSSGTFKAQLGLDVLSKTRKQCRPCAPHWRPPLMLPYVHPVTLAADRLCLVPERIAAQSTDSTCRDRVACTLPIQHHAAPAESCRTGGMHLQRPQQVPASVHMRARGAVHHAAETQTTSPLHKPHADGLACSRGGIPALPLLLPPRAHASRPLCSPPHMNRRSAKSSTQTPLIGAAWRAHIS